MVGISVVWKDYELVVEKAVCSVVRWDNLMVNLIAEKLVALMAPGFVDEKVERSIVQLDMQAKMKIDCEDRLSGQIS